MKTQLTKNNGSITSIMAFAFALLCAIGISGCGSNSAEDVAKSFTKAMAKEDIEDAFEMFQWPVMGLVLDVKTVEKARILFMKQYNDYWKHGKGVGYELSPITVAKKIIDEADYWKLAEDDPDNGIKTYEAIKMVDSVDGRDKIEHGIAYVTVSMSPDGKWRVQSFPCFGNYGMIAE